MADANNIRPAADDPRYPEMDPTGTVDLSQIDCNLALTPAQRVKQLQSFIEFARVAREARIKRYGFDPATPATAPAAE